MEKYLKKIVDETYKSAQQDIYSNYGLLGGKMGQILFFYYYSLIDNNYRELADIELDKLINNISQGNIPRIYSFCNGLAGMGIGFHMLEEGGFIEGTDDMLDDMDSLLMYSLTKDIASNEYDFLHGAIGTGFYYLKHYKYKPETSLPAIKRIIDYLADTAIYDEKTGGYKWIEIAKDYENKNGGHPTLRFNLSLSHGMSSITIFLSRAVDMDISEIDNEKVKKLLDGAITFIINQKIDYKIYGSFFPNMALESLDTLTKSRLAWCYGDMGVALALWKGGKTLNRQDSMKLAVETLLFATTRTEQKDTMAFDAGLCHGTAGVGQIFHYMYKETQETKFFNTYKYWKDETVSMLYHTDGIGGHKKFNGRDKIWETSATVLEGSAGVGLFLLSEHNADWDEILLLNFK